MRGRYIGVDVGGTKLAVGVVQDGVLASIAHHRTERGDRDAAVGQLAEVVAAAGPADAVGVGVPSVVDWQTGTPRFSVNTPLAEMPLRDLLTERLGLPVVVDNDAQVAALAEAWEPGPPARPAVRHLVMFTVGTGVGGGLVIDGRPYRGATGAAPEIGHMIVALAVEEDVPAPAGRFPQPGSLERLAMGPTLDALARGRGFADGPDALRAAQADDGEAAAIFRLLGRRLGLGIANAVNLLEPDVVAVGGGVSAAGALLLEPAEEVARGYMLPGVGTRTEIRVARRGPEAGMYGAALLAWQEAGAPT